MKKQQLKLLRQINKEAYDKYGEGLMTEEYVAPDLIKVWDEALKDPKKYDIDDEKLEKLKTIYDSGYIHQKEMVENEDKIKEFDEYVDKRIKEEIKKGNLPKKEDDKDYQQLMKKKKQYANRQKSSAKQNK